MRHDKNKCTQATRVKLGGRRCVVDSGTVERRARPRYLRHSSPNTKFPALHSITIAVLRHSLHLLRCTATDLEARHLLCGFPSTCVPISRWDCLEPEPPPSFPTSDTRGCARHCEIYPVLVIWKYLEEGTHTSATSCDSQLAVKLVVRGCARYRTLSNRS